MTGSRLPALPSVPFCRAGNVASAGLLRMLGKAPDDPLFTADQTRVCAESYAATRVAEALEEAVKRAVAAIHAIPVEHRTSGDILVHEMQCAIRANG